MSRSLFALACCALSLLSGAAGAGTIVSLKSPAPEGVDIAFQLTDGRVLGQSFNEQHWYILTPDNQGSYVNGTWSRAADLPATMCRSRSCPGCPASECTSAAH